MARPLTPAEAQTLLSGVDFEMDAFEWVIPQATSPVVTTQRSLGTAHASIRVFALFSLPVKRESQILGCLRLRMQFGSSTLEEMRTSTTSLKRVAWRTANDPLTDSP